MNYNKNNKKGFALIELMIAVAIVGVLSAVAVPAYQDYTVRAQISEGIVLAEGVKPMITEYHATHGEYPTSNADVGYSGATGKYVTSISIQQDGNIVATLGNEASSKLQGKRLILTPTVNGGTEIIVSNASSILDKLLGIGSVYAADPTGWSCYSDVEAKYLPKTCEHRTISGSNGGTDPEQGGGEGPAKSWIGDENSTAPYLGVKFVSYRLPSDFVDTEMLIGMTETHTILQPTSLSDVNIYTSSFKSPDGTTVFDTATFGGPYDFLAVTAGGDLVYRLKGATDSYKVSDNGTKEVYQNPSWLTDYFASEDYIG